MKPAFFITTTHHVLAFDGDDRFYRVHSGKGLYYGIAEHKDQIFVSCRNQTIGPENASARAAETGSILSLDRSTLKPMAEFRPEQFPLRDVHGIACFDERLWVCSSFDNLIAVFDTITGDWTRWYPSIDIGARGHDVNHFNTILPEGDHICLVAHNNGPSQLLYYDRSSLELCSVLQLGYQAHDVFHAGGGVATCSSGAGMLVASTGWALRTGGFPRGVAYSSDRILVGISQITDRSTRHTTSGMLRCFTSDWRYVADYVLHDVGMVLSICRVNLDCELSDIPALRPFDVQCFADEYNPLEPADIYHIGEDGNAVFAAEWHAAEGTHRWTASRSARSMVVINPGDGGLVIHAGSVFPGPYWAEVLLNGQQLGVVCWSEPGFKKARFLIPPGVEGTCELRINVPHLWRPSAHIQSGDDRLLGISIHDVVIHSAMRWATVD